MTPSPRTPKDVRKDLRRRGMSIAALARQLRAHDQVVRDLLSGKAKGHRGEAHRVAVLMGLKEGVVDQQHAQAANATAEAQAA